MREREGRRGRGSKVFLFSLFFWFDLEFDSRSFVFRCSSFFCFRSESARASVDEVERETSSRAS